MLLCICLKHVGIYHQLMHCCMLSLCSFVNNLVFIAEEFRPLQFNTPQNKQDRISQADLCVALTKEIPCYC